MIRVAPRYHHHCPNKGERDSILDTHRKKGFPGGSDGKESACNAGDLGSIPGSGRSPEEGMATHSSILAWRIPWTNQVVAKSQTQVSY